ncbi:MAG: hypothetical protein LAP85_21470 [Acidobacteriia bacterium]|nr:hypothetical protein [Terriglobia bacterium]
MKRAVTLAMGLILLMALAAFAQGTAAGTSAKTTKPRAVVTHTAMGVVSSVEANKLVLSHRVKGKEEQSTFLINDQTKKEGDMKAGDRATVHYRVEKGQDIATMVKASPAVAKASKPKK